MATLWISRTARVENHHPLAVAFDAARQAFVLHLAKEHGLDESEVEVDDGLIYSGIRGSLEQIATIVKMSHNWGIAGFTIDLDEGDDVKKAKKILKPFLGTPIVELVEP